MTVLFKIFVLLFVWGCSNSENFSVKEYQKMEFNINSSILSNSPIIINSLELNIPKNWDEISSEQFELMEKIFNQDSLMNSFHLINGHSNGTSLILFGETDLYHKNHILENFINKLEISFPKESIHQDKFTINDIKVNQFIATNKTHTTFHLFIELDNLYLMEFLIPLETYEQQIQAIESTIGTIKRKKENNESYS